MKVDHTRLKSLWEDDSLQTCMIAADLGISMTALYREAKALKLPKRYSGRRQDGENDPTPEEIEDRAAVIRAGWTPLETRRRMGGIVSGRWTPPAYVFDGRTVVFSH